MELPDSFVAIYNRDKVVGQGPHETRTFAAQCHCKNVSFTVTIPTTILPLNAYACSCSICRYTHGTYGSFHVSLPQGITPEWTNHNVNLTVYKTASGVQGGHGQRWFCPTCGTHNGHYEPWANQWIIDNALFDEPFWEFITIALPKCTRDGGMFSWIPRIGQRELQSVTDGRDIAPDNDIEISENGEPRLRVECHCGGVSFTIPRPTKEVREDGYMKQFVSPSDPNKWKAFLDFCRDCRLLSSAPFTPWVLIPRCVLEPRMPADLLMGTMKTYASSENCTRGFCGRCGATVLIKSKIRTPSEDSMVLNVAMGLLRAPEGTRAENWVTWRTGKPACVDDGKMYDAGFVDAMVEGHRKWGMETYGEAPEFPVL